MVRGIDCIKCGDDSGGGLVTPISGVYLVRLFNWSLGCMQCYKEAAVLQTPTSMINHLSSISTSHLLLIHSCLLTH